MKLSARTRAAAATAAGRNRQSPLDSCACPACADLRAELAGDSGLLSVLGRKLLIAGWAGTYTRAEKAYRTAHARVSAARRQHLATLRSGGRGPINGPSTSAARPSARRSRKAAA